MSFTKHKIYWNLTLAIITFLSVDLLQIRNFGFQLNNHIANALEVIFDSQSVREIEDLLMESLAVSEAENLEAGMAMIHPDSPNFEDIRLMAEISMAFYDLDFEYEEYEIIELSENQATLKIIQVTKSIDENTDYRDNRVVAIQKLKKYNGTWKFFNLPEIIEIEYL